MGNPVVVEPKGQAVKAALNGHRNAHETEGTGRRVDAAGLCYVLQAQLFGGTASLPDNVELMAGELGKISTIRLSFDTTNAYGTITETGGTPVADAFFETSPARILRLPRRIENVVGDQAVPILTTEPNSAMISEGAQRLVVTDAAFKNPAPVLKPRRLQTVVDYSLESTYIGAGIRGLHPSRDAGSKRPGDVSTVTCWRCNGQQPSRHYQYGGSVNQHLRGR